MRISLRARAAAHVFLRRILPAVALAVFVAGEARAQKFNAICLGSAPFTSFPTCLTAAQAGYSLNKNLTGPQKVVATAFATDPVFVDTTFTLSISVMGFSNAIVAGSDIEGATLPFDGAEIVLDGADNAPSQSVEFMITPKASGDGGSLRIQYSTAGQFGYIVGHTRTQGTVFSLIETGIEITAADADGTCPTARNAAISSIDLDEGDDPLHLCVSLLSDPGAGGPVAMTCEVSGISDEVLTLSPATLTSVTSSNWETAQRITLTAPDDEFARLAASGSLICAGKGTVGGDYADVSAKPPVTVADRERVTGGTLEIMPHVSENGGPQTVTLTATVGADGAASALQCTVRIQPGEFRFTGGNTVAAVQNADYQSIIFSPDLIIPAGSRSGSSKIAVTPLPDGDRNEEVFRLHAIPQGCQGGVFSFGDVLLRIVDDPVFPTQQADVYLYADGNAIDTVTLRAAVGGVAPVAYSLAGAPDGLFLDPATRILSGTVATTAASSDFPVILTATDSGGRTDTQEFTIRVAPPAALTEVLSFLFNTAKTETLPELTGGHPPIVYSLIGDDLPDGLSFTAADRSISGAAETTGNFTITYEATDATGTARGKRRASVSLSVAALKAAAPADLTATPANARLRLAWTALRGEDAGGDGPSDHRVRWRTPASDGPDGTFGTTDDVAAGDWQSASGNDDDGESTGSAAAAWEIPALTNGTTYEAQAAAVNSAGIGAWSASVEDAPETRLAFASQPPNLIVLAGKALAAMELPNAEEGMTDYTFTLTGLPAGLSFTAATRTITGTPAETATPAEITYTVTDAAAASDTLRFTITALAFDLDVDASGDALASDGIIIARYLLGVRGDSVRRGQSAAADKALRKALQAGVETKALDVSGDGAVDGDDGILIARYMLGLRGAGLIAGFTGLDANAVAARIAALMP